MAKLRKIQMSFDRIFFMPANIHIIIETAKSLPHNLYVGEKNTYV
jgi:hypothetical protein